MWVGEMGRVEGLFRKEMGWQLRDMRLLVLLYMYAGNCIGLLKSGPNFGLKMVLR